MVLKKIIVIPTQGLANRLRIITSAKIYINYTQNLTDLHINWIPESCCLCDYYDIFDENANEFDLKELVNYKYIFEENKHTNEILQTLGDNTEVLVIKGGHSFKHPNMTIDNFREEDFILPAGEEKSFFGGKTFRLTIGNKKGTKLILNGKTLVIPEGKENIVKNLIITSKLLD